MKGFNSTEELHKLKSTKHLELPDFSENLESVLSDGKLLQVDGTNVIRVPFGVRQSIKRRPERPERWATLVLPLQPQGSPTPPPYAA